MTGTGSGSDPVTRRGVLPPLGPRGEGWVGIQVAIELGALLLAMRTGGTWSEPAHTLALVLGVAGAAGGVALFAIGARTLGPSFSIWVRPHETATLVTSGPYRYLRHPVCTAQILLILGWSLAWHSLPGLVAGLFAAWYLDRFKLAREEEWLDEHYPAYAAYRDRVRHRMLPVPPALDRGRPVAGAGHRPG